MVDAMMGSGVDRRRSKRTRHKLLKWAGIVLACVLVALFGLTIYRYPFVMDQQRSDAAVAYIQSRHITMADVDGKHLPPPPDPARVNATVAGIDANANGIRDDVELAIFEKYPNDLKLRAAELQYAQELQIELSGNVFDNATWKINAEEESRGYGCIGTVYHRGTDVQNYFNEVITTTNEVENLVFNTVARKQVRENLNEFGTTFSIANNNLCDLTF